MDEDTMLRQCHTLYDAFCREEEDDFEYDPYEEAEARWEMENER